MQPLQIFDQVSHVFNIGAQALANLLLYLIFEISETLNKLAVDEAERSLAFALLVAE